MKDNRILMIKLSLIVTLVMAFLLISVTPVLSIDATKDGPIYGDSEGLARVQALENELHNMRVRQEHPRIFLNQDNLDFYRQRWQDHPAKQDVLDMADNGDLVNLAFAYLMTEDSSYADKTIQKLKELAATLPEIAQQTDKDKQTVDLMALAFDWVYNAMSEDDRVYLIEKIALLDGLNKPVEERITKPSGETFHREEWIKYARRAWPEIALAHHYQDETGKDVETHYFYRWAYDKYWGDAARMYAYSADGTPFEGYYKGADGISWFLTLKSATLVNGRPINLDSVFDWFRGYSYYNLYRTDFARNKEVFHHGVTANNIGGAITYELNRIQNFIGTAYPLTASEDPLTGKTPFDPQIALKDSYSQWALNHLAQGASVYLLNMENYDIIEEHSAIAQVLFYNPDVLEEDPQYATWSEWPFSRLFPGGYEAYMRTSWTGDSAMAGFRVLPAYTHTSHMDYDVNTFVLYRKGVLSPDSGWYYTKDAQGNSDPTNWRFYQKLTVSHNDILVIDPARPDHPKKLSFQAPDPGGVDDIRTMTFGDPTAYGVDRCFIHNSDAHWGKITDFESNPEYDYVVGEAAKAYGDRLDEYYRSAVFIRKPGDKAYFIVFDRVETPNPEYDKRWLMHFVTEPIVNGNKISEEVPGHIDTYDGDLTYAENAFSTSGIYVKTLLPKQHKIRRIGGDGYRYYVEGTEPKNYPIEVEPTMEWRTISEGGHWTDSGQWRIEISPQTQQKRDYFLNVMYMGDARETMADVHLIEEDGWAGVIIDDPELNQNKIMFTKTGNPDYQVSVAGNIPPEAQASANPIKGPAPLTVQFTGSGTDSDGTITGYSWDFGDGNTSTEQNPSYTYQIPGTYTATLTVTDDYGDTGKDTVTITVTDATPPVISEVKIERVTSASAKISWQTDELATSQIDYGQTPDLGLNTPLDAELTKEHLVTITGLTELTTYYFRVKSQDSLGNLAISDIGTFKTTTAGAQRVEFQQGVDGYSGTECTHLISQSPHSNGGASPYMMLNANPIDYAMIKFNDIIGDEPGKIPTGASIVSATLGLYHSDYNNAGDIKVHRMKVDTNYGTSWGQAKPGEVTWDYLSYDTIRWGNNTQSGPLVGVDYDEVADAILAWESGTMPAWRELDITTLVQKWVDGMPNYGTLLIQDGGQIRLRTAADKVDISERPKLIVEYILPPEDTTPPATISDVKTSPGSSDTEKNLTWTAPGDDGDVGTAAKYIVKYAVTSIEDKSPFPWDTATEVAGAPTPQPAGSQESMLVTDLPPLKVVLSWKAIPEAVSYNIYWYEQPNRDNETIIATGVTDLQWTNTEHRMYWSYYVTGVDAEGREIAVESPTIEYMEIYRFAIRAEDDAGNISDLDIEKPGVVVKPSRQ